MMIKMCETDKELINMLTSLKCDDIPWFSFKGISLICRVIKVYDGDTIVVAFRNSDGKVYKKKCRLLGVDTPEIRSKNINEKIYGERVRDFLSETINDKIVYIKCDGWSKYGDILGTVYLTYEDIENSHNSINDKLLLLGYAQPYDGKKKIPWKL